MSLSQQDAPRVTHHFDLRWVSRTKDFDIDSLLSAWEESEPVDVKDRSYTEARLNETHDVILIVQNDAITTVLHADSEEFEPVYQKRRCQHCGYTARVPPTAACDWCGSSEQWMVTER